jgi:biotin transport system substrate-specific component
LRNSVLIVGGSLLVAGLAQLSIPLQPVPVTGQTLGVLLVGAALGWRRGGLALLAYLAEGLVGLPVFAEGRAGLPVLLGPTGGYLVGFILAAALVGFLAERAWDRTPWLMALALVLGNLVIYAVGVPWLAVVLRLPPQPAYQFGMGPFLIGDALKLAVAMVLLPGAWFIARRGKAGVMSGM